MVAVEREKGGDGCRIELRPNYSLTHEQALMTYGGIVLVGLSIAIAFAIAGMWVVLPFAGLELIALGYAFWVCARRGDQREVITVGREAVRIESGRSRPESRYEFPRGWAQVELVPSPITWYPSKLMIRSHGERLEVGSFLSEDERRKLVSSLREALAWQVGNRDAQRICIQD